MKNVAIFGGSFDPPHVAHQLLMMYVLETEQVDELWMVPTFRHAFDKQLTPFDDRVAMCQLAARPLGERVKVSLLERELAERPGFIVSRTLHLLEALRELCPDVAPRLLIGADILGETHAWHRFDEVARLAPPIVVGRSGHPVPPGATGGQLEMPAVSSTEIRRRLAAHEDSSGLLPRSVLRYIRDRGIYGS